MFGGQSVERVAFQTKLVVQIGEVGLAWKGCRGHGLGAGDLSSELVGAIAGAGGAIVCVVGRTGK